MHLRETTPSEESGHCLIKHGEALPLCHVRFLFSFLFPITDSLIG